MPEARAANAQKYSLDDLRYLMRRLRDPDTGCPWDIKQTFQTIAPYTLEEIYEVIDTIEREDYSHLREELGDLLFQVIFYSQLGEEQSLFGFEEIVSGLVEKLVVRHPHVFPDGTLHSQRSRGDMCAEGEIKQTWETIKKTEREEKGKQGILADIPPGLPALIRATKLQKRAANHGFDWPDVDGPLEKLQEEIGELSEAIAANQTAAIVEEVGDVLFTVVNVCRHLGVESESALRSAARKFEQRFNHMEQQAELQGRFFDDLDTDEMEQLWLQAKVAGDNQG